MARRATTSTASPIRTTDAQERADDAVCLIARTLAREPDLTPERITEVTAEHLTDDPLVDRLILEQVHDMRVIMGM